MGFTMHVKYKFLLLCCLISFSFASYTEKDTLSLEMVQDRAVGTFLWSTWGDVLGREIEFTYVLDDMFKQYPHGITGIASLKNEWNFLPEKFGRNKEAPYTDDTRMAMLVGYGLTTKKVITIEDINIVLPKIVDLFIQDGNDNQYGWTAFFRAAGAACKAGVHRAALLERKEGFWNQQSIFPTAGGSGSVMRAYPCGIKFWCNPELACKYAVAQSRITHGAPMADAACAALAEGVSLLIQGYSVTDTTECMIEIAKNYDTSTAQKIVRAIKWAQEGKKLLPQKKISSHELITFLQDRKGNFRNHHNKVFGIHGDPKRSWDPDHQEFLGWAADDAIAAAVYCFSLFPNDPELCVLLGVHTVGDSDSIACMAGALVGAHNGVKHFSQSIHNELKQIEDYEKLKQLAQQLVQE
jgi:ADP-ribosylglycohydrolase